MKNLKKTLRIGAILCLAMAGLDVGFLIFNIVNEPNTFAIVNESICILLSIATAITYFVFANKKQDDIIKYRNAFFWITIVNVFNSLLTWVITFWMQLAVGQVADAKRFTEMYANLTNKSMVNMTPQERENLQIQNNAQTLTNKLQELNHLKEKGEITEEQYNQSRQKLIDEYI